jgi:hypothetical protein
VARRRASPDERASTDSGRREWQSAAGRKAPVGGREARSSFHAPPEAPPATSQESALMFDVAAIAIALGCFAFIFLLLYVLERV